MEIGKYIRSSNGEIGKIIEIKENPDRCFIDNCGQMILLSEIVKQCSNILNLLEEGDIVEIELSEEFVNEISKKQFVRIGDVYTKETLQKDIDNGIISKIVSILTNEQYRSNSYKVVDKEGD